ncbi:MAG: histidine phosphatase family protein [Anaerovoracaceae bacterium]
MSSKIILIRHGITEGNARHWFYGAADVSLLPEGAETIKRYKRQGMYPEVPEDAQFFTTGLLRTRQTLELIYGKREFGEIPELQEMHFGQAEKRTYDELRDLDGFEEWSKDTTGDAKLPGAESANEFRARVKRGETKLLDLHRMKEWSHRHGGQDAVTVVVCHGGVISAMMDDFFPEVLGTMWDWIPDPGMGYVVETADGDPYMYTRISDIKRLGLTVKNDAGEKAPGLISAAAKRKYTFFDYEIGAPGSETIEKSLRKTLVYGRPERDAFRLSAKLPLSAVLPEPGRAGNAGKAPDPAAAEACASSFRKAVISSVGRTAAGQLDYLAAEVTDKTADDFNDLSILDVLMGLKEQGFASKVGIAYRGTPEKFEKLLAENSSVDFVRFSVNYADQYAGDRPSERFAAAARKFYKPVMVDGPLRGGVLASPGKKAEKVIAGLDPDSQSFAEKDSWQQLRSERGIRCERRKGPYGSLTGRKGRAYRRKCDCISWAYRCAMTSISVIVTLCAVSTKGHALMDIDAAEAFKPLTAEEKAALAEAGAAVDLKI